MRFTPECSDASCPTTLYKLYNSLYWIYSIVYVRKLAEIVALTVRIKMDVRIEYVWLFDLFDSMYLSRIGWMIADCLNIKILNPLIYILSLPLLCIADQTSGDYNQTSDQCCLALNSLMWCRAFVVCTVRLYRWYAGFSTGILARTYDVI